MNLLTILKVDGLIYSGKFQSVKVPGKDGELTILPNHTPLLTGLKEGELVYVDDFGNKNILEIKEGFLEINNREVLIIL